MAGSRSKQDRLGKSVTEQTSKQKDWQTTYYGKTEDSRTDSGQTSRTYKDLSGLSPAALAMETYFMNHNTYTPTQAETAAKQAKDAKYNQIQNRKGYDFGRQGSLDQTLDALQNMGPFNYNFNEDAMYDMYRQQYEQQAKEAERNAAARAAALSGGYGSSYGASAAAQAGQQYMTQLNSMLPQFEQMALDRYNAENDRLSNLYSILNAEDEKGYGRWTDEDTRLRADLDYLNNDYLNTAQLDRQAFQDAFNNNLAGFQAEAALRGVDVNDVSEWSQTHNQSGGKDKVKSGSTTTTNSKTTETEKVNSSSYSSGSGGGGRNTGGSGGDESYSLLSDKEYKYYKDEAAKKLTGYSDAQAWSWLYARYKEGKISSVDMKDICNDLGIHFDDNDLGVDNYKGVTGKTPYRRKNNTVNGNRHYVYNPNSKKSKKK